MSLKGGVKNVKKSELTQEELIDYLNDLLFYNQYILYEDKKKQEEVKKKLKKLRKYVKNGETEKYMEETNDTQI